MEKPTYYSILDSHIRYSKELSFFEKVLYSEITALTNKNGYATAKNGYFAEVFDISTRTISKTISKFDKLGILKVIIIKDKDTNQVVERRLYLVQKKATPMEADFHTPMEADFHTPMEADFQENNININITRNNTSKERNNSKLNNAKKLKEKDNPPLFENSKLKNETIKDDEENKQLPKNVIEAYKKSISSKNELIQEPASINQIALASEDIPKMITGIQNYSEYLKKANKKPEKLFFFVRNKIYLDFQKKVESEIKVQEKQNKNAEYKSKAAKSIEYAINYFNARDNYNNLNDEIIDVRVENGN